MPLVGPSIVLAVLVGVFWTAFAVLVTGVAGARLPFVAILAVLGAWAGDALGGRLGIDVLRIGDFRLVAASAGAWLGIAFVVLVSILGPSRDRGPGPTGGG
ncbi:MAG: hypothetical protein M0T75_06270 [Chloroflexi bacterium]|nr:hypothetical protein [Chloroflexota bacterium]